MKNLFYYATKELSQDAFIMWLISNYDEEDNPELMDVSLSFISFLTNNAIDKETLKNSRIEVFSQVDHTDVSIDIYTNKESKMHDIIVIEDKVGSSEHNQLIDYNEAIDKKWKNKERVFKVFYKTGKVTEKDINGLKKANNDNKTGEWVLYDLDRIYGFFKDKTNSKSQVLNDYISFLEHINKALNYETDDEIKKWKSYHWEGFANAFLQKYDNSKSDKEEYVWVDSYQGRYTSICYQRCLPNSKDATVIEFFVRNGNKITAVLHHAFYDGTERRKWSVEKCEHFKDEKELLRKQLRKYISEIAGTPGYEKIGTVKSNASKSFGKISSEPISVDSIKDVESRFEEWINLFIKVVDNFKQD